MAEVKLSQESYDELLSDITALRLQADTFFEQWQDCLLYTSPSPRDQRGSRMPSSA